MSESGFAIVTGASSGIGLQVVESLLSRGFFVFGASRTGAGIEDDNYLELDVDIRDESSIASMFNAVREITDGIHLVVHAAGIFDYKELGVTTSENFQNIFETNTAGTFHLYKHLEEFLIPEETHIINILSMAAKKAYPYMTAFCSAEAAKKNFIDSIKKEWKKEKVRVTNFFIGAVDTPFWDSIDENVDKNSMLELDELMYVLDTLLDASPMIQFHDITISHVDDESI